MPERVYNFGAGPCTLPLPVLEEAQKEFVNFQNTGMSLLEMSHRGKEYDAVHHEAMDLALEIFQAPSEFSVLFIQGGATLQFAMVPLNLLNDSVQAGYVVSGHWGKGALTDAQPVANAYAAWDGAESGYTRMPADNELMLGDQTRYLHITSNETIGGIRYEHWPDTGVPLVADMSSDYMSRPVDWNKFDLIYGGTQKNLGPAGMAVVFIRTKILDNTNREIPRYLRYDLHQAKESMFNTPPVFSVYMLGKVLKWMKARGGLQAMQEAAEKKSKIIYETIDNSNGFYRSPVDPNCRSQMNIVFRMPEESLEKQFLEEADRAGLVKLKGHRSVGGCRASIYNAMPLEGVKALQEFMHRFQKQHS
ncbi:MAG: 3-phosphoserine/phosphohydroxythreonine transaminase [Desulfohalobiaceae bacterium]|nr:3-phosphoserine/phosphohydroxythreonine transaminase [Desulfohalobiaceae bacterium]